MTIKTFYITNKPYSYEIRYSKKAKHIRLQISHEGKLELIIPVRVKNFNAESFLAEKRNWIEKHLSRFNQRKQRFFYLGKEIELEKQYDLFCKNYSARLIDNKLIFSCPGDDKISLEQLYKAWIKEKADNYIVNRAKALCEMYGFSYNKISIKNQKTRWGSCSTKKTLSFNSKLMYFNDKVIDYVVIHEMCHLKEMNHSNKFWKLVAEIMPEYKKYKAQLKQTV